LPEHTAEVALGNLTIGQLRVETHTHLTTGRRATSVASSATWNTSPVGVRDVPKPALAGVSALLTFATFSGVGDRTTKGVGWVDLAGNAFQ